MVSSYSFPHKKTDDLFSYRPPKSDYLFSYRLITAPTLSACQRRAAKNNFIRVSPPGGCHPGRSVPPVTLLIGRTE